MDLRKIMMSFVVAGVIANGPIMVHAASGKCTVIETEGDRIVIECPEQGGEFQKGDAIKIKSDKKSGAVEGC